MMRNTSQKVNCKFHYALDLGLAARYLPLEIRVLVVELERVLALDLDLVFLFVLRFLCKLFITPVFLLLLFASSSSNVTRLDLLTDETLRRFRLAAELALRAGANRRRRTLPRAIN